MQLAATIAVVVSVLVLAFQARELTRQSRIANQVAGGQADRDLVRLLAETSGVFLQYPELRAYFFDQKPAPSSVTDARLLTVADQHADALQTLLDAATRLGPYGWRRDEVMTFVTSTLAASTPLRSIIRDNPGVWPPLEPLVANYDASHDGRADRPAVPSVPVADLPPEPEPGQQ